MPTRALTSQKIALRKANASSALKCWHWPEPKLLDQSKVEPQESPRKLTIKANETIQAANRKRSIGQWMKPPENGRSHRRARRIEMAAITSV